MINIVIVIAVQLFEGHIPKTKQFILVNSAMMQVGSVDNHIFKTWNRVGRSQLTFQPCYSMQQLISMPQKELRSRIGAFKRPRIGTIFREFAAGGFALRDLESKLIQYESGSCIVAPFRGRIFCDSTDKYIYYIGRIGLVGERECYELVLSKISTRSMQLMPVCRESFGFPLPVNIRNIQNEHMSTSDNYIPLRFPQKELKHGYYDFACLSDQEIYFYFLKNGYIQQYNSVYKQLPWENDPKKLSRSFEEYGIYKSSLKGEIWTVQITDDYFVAFDGNGTIEAHFNGKDGPSSLEIAKGEKEIDIVRINRLVFLQTNRNYYFFDKDKKYHVCEKTVFNWLKSLVR